MIAFAGSCAVSPNPARSPGKLSSLDAYRLSGRIVPWAAWAAAMFGIAGLVQAYFLPVDQKQAGLSLVALFYVASSWLAALLCVSMAFWAAIGIVLERPIAFLLSQSSAPTGGMFSFLALLCGGAWSRAQGGAWWSGEVRQIAELLLMIWYLGMIGVPVLIDRIRIADRLSAVVALFAVASVCVLYFGGAWLGGAQRHAHWGYGGVGLAGDELLVPIGFVAVGLWFYATAAIAIRFRCALLQRYALAGPERGPV